MPRGYRSPATAGEIVSWFEDMPVELARTVLEIVAERVKRRTVARDAVLSPEGGRVVVVKRPRGRPSKADKEAIGAAQEGQG